MDKSKLDVLETPEGKFYLCNGAEYEMSEEEKKMVEAELKHPRVLSFAENQPHIVQELICIRCKKRFIDVRPKDMWLKDCQCPKCKKRGFLIATGQELNPEDWEK